MPGNIINRRGRFVYEILTAEGQFISRHVDGLKRFVGNVEKYQRFEEDQEWTKVKMKQPANLPTDNTTNNSAVVEISSYVRDYGPPRAPLAHSTFIRSI